MMKVGYKLKKNLNSTLSVVFGLFVVLSFQNCADLDNSDVISLTDVERDVLSSLPFAYNLKIDQLAYMSCSGSFAQDEKAFTFKAGGFFPGSGVGLRSNFSSQIQELNADAKVRSLAISERNDQAGVVMAIRPRSNLQDYVDPSGASGEITYAKMMFNEPQGLLLSNERVARQLMALGANSYMNYVAGIPGLANKSFDGIVRISSDSEVENDLRNMLRNSHYLALNFAEPLGDQPPGKPYSYVRSPYDTLSGDSRANTSVFGLGYVLNFQQFDSHMTSSPQRAMTITNAINLENSVPESEQWDCSERFVVVRPQDASRLTFMTNSSGGLAQVCDTAGDRAPANATEQRRWDRIRNILPVEDWYVTLPATFTSGIKPGCIVPKGNVDFCYGEDVLNDTQSNIRVAYYRNEDLDMDSVNINYNGNCGPGTHFVCPHIVTLCYKR